MTRRSDDSPKQSPSASSTHGDFYGPSGPRSKQAFNAASAELEKWLHRWGLGSISTVDDKKLAELEKMIQDRAQGGLSKGVLTKLALMAMDDGKTNAAILSKMRDRQEALKSLAERLSVASTIAKPLLADPSYRIETWACVHGIALVMGRPLQKWADSAEASEAVNGMESLSRALDDEQKRFGNYLRHLGRVDSHILELLLDWWILQTKHRGEKLQFPIDEDATRVSFHFQLDHLDKLARLMTIAFDCTGKRRRFTADGLRRVFERHAVPLLKLFFEDARLRSVNSSTL